MIPICTETEEIIHPAELRSDEYIVNDGLIYCSKCHTPRQKRIEVSGKTIEPRCMCACQTEDYDRREQERKHREFLDMVAKNRSIGLPDPGLLPSVVILCLAGAHAARFYHFFGNLNPLLPGCITFAAVD